MKEYYHRTIASLIGWWDALTFIPKIIKWDDEDFNRRTTLIIIKRVAKSRYYHKHAERQECGCDAIGNHYTSYLSDCEEHMGWLKEYTSEEE